MAPRGQHTYSRQCFLALSIGLVAIAFIAVAVFHKQLLSSIKALKITSVACTCPQPPHSEGLAHDTHNHQHQGSLQPQIPTIYADLTILDELSPANVLWVNTSNPTTSDEGQPNDSAEHKGEPEAWGISMFHALHCVKMWRDSLDPATATSAHVHSESEYVEHADHCIKYLVQSLVCAADATIEPAEHIEVNGMHGKRIHGMGYQHQCRDTGLLFEMDGQTVGDWGWRQGDTLYSVFG